MLANAGLSSCSLILSHRKDVPELLKAMDVFLFPSLYEGLGLSLIEAQASGLRCFVSDRIPREACLTNLVITVKLEEPIEDWCDALLKLNDESACLDRLGEYDIHKTVRELEKLYCGNA